MEDYIMVLRLSAVVLAGFVAVAGCEPQASPPPSEKVTPADLRQDADKLGETAAQFARQTKEEFQQKLDARLKDLDSEIATLREKGRELKDESKVKWDQKMADLEVKREAARAKLGEVTNSSAEAWKDVRKGAQSAWDDLDKALKEASSEF
jgi:TolA-binding protein